MRLTVARVRKTVLRELYAMFLRAPQNATTFEVGDERSAPHQAGISDRPITTRKPTVGRYKNDGEWGVVCL